MAKVDKEKAVTLRKEGKTYPEIAEALKCSEDWCKRNLKGILKEASEPENEDSEKKNFLIAEIRRFGRRPDGVTDQEVRSMVKAKYPLWPVKELSVLVKGLKQKAKRGSMGKDVLIRPAWLSPDTPKASVDIMMVMAQEVYEFMHHQGHRYRQEFDLPESCQSSIVYELSRLSAGEFNKLMPQGLLHYGTYLEDLAGRLDERADQIETKDVPRVPKALGSIKVIEEDDLIQLLEEELAF